MNQLEILLAQPPAQAIGWALIHFVWQGAAVALLLAILLAALACRSAHARYVAACGALLVMLVLPLATAGFLLSGEQEADSPASGARGIDAGPDAQAWYVFHDGVAEAVDAEALTSGKDAGAAGWVERARLRLQPLLPWLLSAWFAGVLGMSVRLAGGWVAARRLRNVGTREASPSLQETLKRLARRLRISRPVRLLESTLAQVPAAVGWLRPAVLLPASALTGLTPGQLEAMIAHELAHIRRHDFLVNFIQSVVETFLFYHPAVWWISRRIRVEREYCCDDLAVAVCGDAIGYARALAEMEMLRGPVPAAAVAASGGSLMARVRRLVHPHAGRRHLLSGLLAWISVLGALVSAGAFATLSVATAQMPLPGSADLVEDPSLRLRIQREIHERTAALLSKGDDACVGGLEDPDWITRAASARCLAVRGEDEETAVLLGALEDSTWWVRKEAALAYASIGAGKAPRPLIDLLEDADPEVRELAARSLGRIGDGEARPALRRALEDPAAEVREAAAWALGAVSGSSEVENLIERLRDQDPDVRENAALLLGENGDFEAAWALAGALDDKKPAVRKAAAWALGEIADDRAAEKLIRGLQDERKEVRKRTALALGEMGNPLAVDPLLRSLEEDGEPAVREASAKGLMMLAVPKASKGLIAALQDGSWKVRRTAAKALGEIGGQESVKPLKLALGDQVQPVREAAVRALTTIEKLRSGKAKEERVKKEKTEKG